MVGGRQDQIDGAVKYVGLNLIATTAMLAGIGLLYGATGSLNMAALHLAVEGNMDQPGILARSLLLLFALPPSPPCSRCILVARGLPHPQPHHLGSVRRTINQGRCVHPDSSVLAGI